MIVLALLLSTVAVPPADLAATGVVVGADPQASVAVLRSAGQTRIVKSGESAFGGRITAISWASVSIDFAGTPVELRVRASERPAPVRAAARGPVAEPRARNAAPIQSIARDELQRRITEETPRLLTETALAPVTENGKVSGLALTRLPAGANLLSDAGLQPGDVLTEINGTAIDGLPALMGLWPRLQTERNVSATVLRNGQPVTLSLTLR